MAFEGFVPTKSNSRFLGFCPLLGVYLDFESKWFLVIWYQSSGFQGLIFLSFHLFDSVFILFFIIFVSVLVGSCFVSVFVLFIFWIWFCCEAYSGSGSVVSAYQFIFYLFPVLSFCSVLPISSS